MKSLITLALVLLGIEAFAKIQAQDHILVRQNQTLSDGNLSFLNDTTTNQNCLGETVECFDSCSKSGRRTTFLNADSCSRPERNGNCSQSQPYCFKSRIKDYVNFCDSTNVTQLEQGGLNACLVDDSGLKCISADESWMISYPRLKKPDQVSLGSSHGCALQEGKVYCWGGSTRKQTIIPPEGLTNVTAIDSGGVSSCAIANKKVHCWGFFPRFNQPPQELTDPKEVSVYTRGGYNGSICVVDEKTVKCWDISTHRFKRTRFWGVPKDLKNPRGIQLYSSGVANTLVCAKTDDGLRCWNSKGEEGITYPGRAVYDRDLDRIVIIEEETVDFLPERALGSSHFSYGGQMCVLNNAVVDCWWANYFGQASPWNVDLVNPYLVSASTQSGIGGYSCAATEKGIRCWGGVNKFIEVKGVKRNPLGYFCK